MYIITGAATLGDKCSEPRVESAPGGVSRQLGGATMPWSPGRAACLRSGAAITGVSCVLFVFDLIHPLQRTQIRRKLRQL